MPNFTRLEEAFVIGKAQILKEGTDVSIFACGHLVWPALEAANTLQENGINAEVINIHTIKPLDIQAIIQSVQKTGCVVTAEEHERNGGLGDSIAQVLGMHFPAPIEMIAVNDSFGESGKPMELLTKYGLDTPHIVEAAMKSIGRKK